jgi:hypothetical protein
LRVAVSDKGEALRAAEKVCGELCDEIMGWQTHAEGKLLPCSDLDSALSCSC